MSRAAPYRLTDAQRQLAADHARLLDLVGVLPALAAPAARLDSPEDARQTAALGLCRAAHQYDPGHTPGGSFVAFAEHKMRSELGQAVAYRCRRCRAADRCRPLAAGEDGADPRAAAAADPEAFDAAAWLDAAVRHLDPRRRAVIEHRRRGRTHAEIAALLGLTRQRAHQLASSALRRLRQLAAAAAG